MVSGRAFHVAIDGSHGEVEPIGLALEIYEDPRSAMLTKQAVGPLGVGVGLEIIFSADESECVARHAGPAGEGGSV
jgi:hypothetical protein